jgi:hypothetical protein
VTIGFLVVAVILVAIARARRPSDNAVVPV